jgi:hypothetical protein
MDMRFGTRNVRSLYRADSFTTVAKEISKYKLHLVGVQEIRSDKGSIKPASEYTFFYRRGNKNHELVSFLLFFFVCKRIISAVKRVEFVSGRMSYIILRGLWCDIIALNVHGSTENKTDDVKGSFCEEVQCVFDKFLSATQKFC